jgi:hypothetical protein
MPSAAKVSLEERWAGVAGMPDLLTALATYEEELLNHEVAEGSADDTVRDARLAVIVHLRAALGQLDPVLATTQMVAGLTNAVQSARTELSSYGWASQGGENALTDLTRSFGVATNGKVVDLVSSAKDLHNLKSSLESALQGANAALEQLEAARTGFEETADSVIDAGTAKVNEAVATVTEHGTTNFTNKLQEAEVDRESAARAFEEAYESAEQVLGEMREKLSIATDTALSHDYSKAAEAEADKADSMRTRSVVFGIITGVLAIAAVILQAVIVNDSDGGEALALVPGKLAAVAAFGTIAAWLGRESHRHREAARSLRLTELQLRNLGSFLAELDPDDRNEARVRLLGRFFSDHPEPIAPDGPSHLSALQQLAAGQEAPPG